MPAYRFASSRATAGLHPSHIARIEADQVQASIESLTAISVALGADLSLRFYAGAGPRIHDRFQATMIEALLPVRHPRWTPGVEVAIARPGRGVADMLLDDAMSPLTVVGEVHRSSDASRSRFAGLVRRPMGYATGSFEMAQPTARSRNSLSSDRRRRPERWHAGIPRSSRRRIRPGPSTSRMPLRVRHPGRGQGSCGCDSRTMSPPCWRILHEE